MTLARLGVDESPIPDGRLLTHALGETNVAKKDGAL